MLSQVGKLLEYTIVRDEKEVLLKTNVVTFIVRYQLVFSLERNIIKF